MPKHDLIEHINELRKYDHAFITVEGAHELSKPFGFVARTHIAHADPTNPKGLTFANGAKQARGVAAEHLAIQICGHVGVEYREMLGRGSQLRECCDALEAWAKS